MSEQEPSANEGARRLQAVIDSVARRSLGRPLDETVRLLRDRLSDAGLAAPPPSWVDAVAREAVSGRSYIVATDAQLLGLDETPGARALQEAPATLTITTSVPP